MLGKSVYSAFKVDILRAFCCYASLELLLFFNDNSGRARSLIKSATIKMVSHSDGQDMRSTEVEQPRILSLQEQRLRIQQLGKMRHVK